MSRRTERVAERIRQELSLEIRKLKDPDIGFVTVTNVEVSPDLEHAWVDVSVLTSLDGVSPTGEAGDDAAAGATLTALRRAAGYLQHRIGGALKTRTTPELRFRLDRSAERQAEMSDLIRQARSTDADHAEADEPPEAEGPRDPGE